MKKELIVSVQGIVPSKGTNAGKTMYLVNGEYWCKSAPTSADTHIVLQDVEVDGKAYTNVTGFAADVRMPIQEKIGILTQHEASYSNAIAMLLK
jgi:hypothetical protein